MVKARSAGASHQRVHGAQGRLRQRLAMGGPADVHAAPETRDVGLRVTEEQVLAGQEHDEKERETCPDPEQHSRRRPPAGTGADALAFPAAHRPVVNDGGRQHGESAEERKQEPDPPGRERRAGQCIQTPEPGGRREGHERAQHDEQSKHDHRSV